MNLSPRAYELMKQRFLKYLESNFQSVSRVEISDLSDETKSFSASEMLVSEHDRKGLLVLDLEAPGIPIRLLERNELENPEELTKFYRNSSASSVEKITNDASECYGVKFLVKDDLNHFYLVDDIDFLPRYTIGLNGALRIRFATSIIKDEEANLQVYFKFVVEEDDILDLKDHVIFGGISGEITDYGNFVGYL